MLKPQFDERRELQANAWYPRMLSIARHDSLAELGCGWVPESNQRGILYSQALWNKSVGVDTDVDAPTTKLVSKAEFSGVRVETKS